MSKKRRLLGLLPIPLAWLLSDGTFSQFIALMIGGLVFWVPYWLAWWLSDGFDLSQYANDCYCCHCDHLSSPYDIDGGYSDPAPVVKADFNMFTNKIGLSKGQGANKRFLC
jgi:hypothetical protein